MNAKQESSETTVDQAREAYRALMTDALKWAKDGDGQKAEASGFMLTIAREVENDKPTRKWSWKVTASGKTLAADIAGSEGGAKRSASRAARKLQAAKAAKAKPKRKPVTAPTVRATKKAA